MKKKEKISVYEIITNKILEQLDKGIVPWKKTWKGDMFEPKNIRGTGYRGVNRLLLGFNEYDSPYWLTYKQALELKGFVKKGEKSTMITYWNFIEKDEVKDDGNGGTVTKKKKIGFMRYYRVFNFEQCEFPEDVKKKFEIKSENNHDPIKEAEAIIKGYKDKPEIKLNGGKPSYSPTLDRIKIPDINHFEKPENYYSVLFHEATHSTGHENRCKRDIKNFFGNDPYAKEELVAEIGACFLNSKCGVESENLENNVAYLRSWREQLSKDSKLIISASSQAQRSTDWILGKKYEEKE